MIMAKASKRIANGDEPVTRTPSKADAQSMERLYYVGLDTQKALATATRDYVKSLAVNPDLEQPDLAPLTAALKEVRQQLRAIPVGTRVRGATLEDVIGAIFGTKSKTDCRKITKEAFGR